jgi:hypothetical protein
VKRISILLVAVSLGLAMPAAATAQLGPTNVPAPLTQPDDTADTTPFEEDTGLSTLQLVLMFGGAIAIVALIAWIIMRDAHRAAPATDRGRAGEAAAGAGGAPRKSAREREREQARKRAKAKAARNQRKRNRPR